MIEMIYFNEKITHKKKVWEHKQTDFVLQNALKIMMKYLEGFRITYSYTYTRVLKMMAYEMYDTLNKHWFWLNVIQKKELSLSIYFQKLDFIVFDSISQRKKINTSLMQKHLSWS